MVIRGWIAPQLEFVDGATGLKYAKTLSGGVRNENAVLWQRQRHIWSSIVYEALECLDQVGTLYKVKPLGEAGPFKVIHLTELKPLPGGQACTSPSAHMEAPGQEEPDESGLLRLEIAHTRPSTMRNLAYSSVVTDNLDPPPIVRNESLPTDPILASNISPPPVAPSLIPPTEEEWGRALRRLDPLGPPPVQRLDCSALNPTPDPTLKRSSRHTAGQHSNPYHLPQSASRESSLGTVSVNAAYTPFQAWQMVHWDGEL